MRDAILLGRLRRWNLEVRVLSELVVLDGKNGVATHLHHARRLTHRLCATAPFVGKHDLRTIVTEHRSVPEREVCIGLCIEAHRPFRITNVDE
jgi:hypothetical protein